jgi:hypothetical protein
VRGKRYRLAEVREHPGRREERALTTSSLLNAYLDWPGVAQVFKLERRTIYLATGAVGREGS